MQDLIKQEQFELEVLDALNTLKVLPSLLFVGGTMLRLCYGLKRFSVDLDFWIYRKTDTDKLYDDIKNFLKKSYIVTDSKNKLNTLLFEIKSEKYPRRLKIEIRKKFCSKNRQAIAYSRYSSKQVLVNTLKLENMIDEKIKTFLNRGEIRDVFDIEFLYRKGNELKGGPEDLKKLLKKIEKLTTNDYRVKLGSLISADQRSYYTDNNFIILKDAIVQKLNQGG